MVSVEFIVVKNADEYIIERTRVKKIKKDKENALIYIIKNIKKKEKNIS